MCARSATFGAPGVMFRINLETGALDRTLPLYKDDIHPSPGDRLYRPELYQGDDFANGCCLIGGGQIFRHALKRKSFGQLQCVNLPFPLGVYFSDSFAPPRFQYHPQEWVLIDRDTIRFQDAPEGIFHRLAFTFGTPLDPPPQTEDDT
jgi:hypothetical protein